MENITQKEIVIEFFERNPKRDVKHPEVVDGATSEYQNRTGNVFRDPDRQIRKLHQAGILIKVGTGIYRYDPDFVENKELESFTEKQKKEILARDKFRCVQCGKGLQDGVRLEVDHIKPKDKGGKATIENGQVLCAPHKLQEKELWSNRNR